MKFQCGVAREDITPEIGTHLFGYNPYTLAESVHDNLTITAVSFADEKQTVLLLSTTVGEYNTKIATEIRKKIAEYCNIDMRNIILTATHTHSAPNVCGMDGWGEVDNKYIENILLPKAIKVSANAIRNLAYAEIGTNVGRSEVGINRRQQNQNGEISLGQNPWGIFDPNMTVLMIRRVDNKAGILNLVHYGCHGTAAGCNHEITRDWSGMMIDRAEKITGTLTVFFNGAIGDVGPRLSNGCTIGDITYVEELGSIAASDCIRIIHGIKTFAPAEIKIFYGTVRLPYRPQPELSEVRAKLAEIKEPEKLINIQRFYYEHLKAVENLICDETMKRPTHFEFEQTIIAVGNTVFIPFPFEHFSEISLRLREYSGYQHTLTLSNANGSNAYLPSQDQICRGGYEVECFCSCNLFNLTDDADQHIINENIRILENK